MYTNRTKYIRLTTTFSLDSDDDFRPGCRNLSTTTDNSPCQDYTHPDDHTITCYPRVGSRVQTIYWKHLLWKGKNISVPTLIFCFNWMWYQRPFLSQVWLFCDLSLWSWPAIVPSFFVQFSSAIFFWSRRQCVEIWDLSSVIDKNSAFG